MTVEDASGKDVGTIEGLASRRGHPIFRAWLAEQVPQCGYCQPGMIMAAAALLAHRPQPTDAEMDEALAHVLCRCGSYPRVRRAIHRAAPAPPQGDPIRFNPWVSVAPDGIVVVTIERSEMGQGVNTALAMLVAEELDVPLERVRTEFAPADHIYDNPVIGMQITVGSMSVQNAWGRLRRAGADARERLISAGATRWNVPVRECRTSEGSVIHMPSGRAVPYGSLAAAAAALPPIPAPRLKSARDFRLLGKPTARLEVPGHIAGRSIFGMDVSLPGMSADACCAKAATHRRLLHARTQ